MVLNDFVKYYTDLLILQYRNKPKAIGHVDAIVRPALMDLVAFDVQNGFNLTTAVGVQLDILGKYVGISRRVLTFTEAISLSDGDYRSLLRIKIAINNLGSSFFDIQTFIKNQLDNVLYAFDSQNMQMSFYLNSNYISADLAQAIIRGGLLPKPMGVSSSAIIYLGDLHHIFGFISYTYTPPDIVGLNDYDAYDSGTVFVKYEDALIF